MKIAVVSFDHMMKKIKPLLDAQGFEVTYFVLKSAQTIQFENFSSIPVYAERIMIPAKISRQTKKQSENLKNIKQSYQEIQQRLTDSKTAFQESIEVPVGPLSSDRKLDQVMDIYFDAKSRQVLFEIQNIGVEPYDLLICEGHNLITEELGRKSIQIKQKNKTPKYAWASFGFKYELLKPLSSRQENKTFFLVADPLRDSIIDNWFLCQMNESHISFWSFYPESQMNNPEYQDFYIDRIRKLSNLHLPFLQLKSFDNSVRSSIDFEPWNWNESKMNLKNGIVFVPNMGFWSEDQIQRQFMDPLVKSVKKLKSTPGASV